MDQEKNLNEELTDMVADVAEELEETAEVVGEAVEELAQVAEEKVRPEVYDDFADDSEEENVSVVKEKKPLGTSGIIAISSAIATVAAVVIMLLINGISTLIPTIITNSQINGVWALDMSEYEMGNIYVVFDGGEMILTSDDNGVMFTCDYDVVENGKIELSGDSENMMMVSNLIGASELRVSYDKEADALNFSPAIGGVATWEAADKETSKKVIESAEAPAEEPVYEDITGDPAEQNNTAKTEVE